MIIPLRNIKVGLGFISFKISEKVSIQPELLFSQLESNYIIDGRDLFDIPFGISEPFLGFFGPLDGKVAESLILIPVMVKHNLNKKFSLEFGPQLGYSLNRANEIESSRINLMNNSFNPLIQEFLEDTENFELGIVIGLDYALSDRLGILLRYNMGVVGGQDISRSVTQLGVNYAL